jgi:hypothetical protein
MNPYGNDNTMIIPQGTVLLSSNDIVFDSKKNKIYVISSDLKDDTDVKEEIIEDIKKTKKLPPEKKFKSQEFKLFSDPFDDGNNSDNSDIENACNDLAIDG